MRYDLDEHAISLDALRERLLGSDLIPSQEPLLDGLSETFAAIGQAGISSMADLRNALKSQKSLAQLGEETGVDPGYLQLLKRTVNGLLPKPRRLKDMDWLGADVVDKLNGIGIKDTCQLYEQASDGAADLASRAGIGLEDAQALITVSALCRIQWVSPSFARALIAAGCGSARAVAERDPEELCVAIKEANRDARFYKGVVGLRDIKRLVDAASYVD